MIGLGVSIRIDGKVRWEYYNFRVPNLDEDCEYQLFNKMYKKIEEISTLYDIDVENANIYHWGSIEQNIIDNIYKKYEIINDWKTLNLVDFHKIFQDDGILIKDVYGFGLKEISNGLIKHGLIDHDGWDSNVTNGLDAMIQAYNYYKDTNGDTNYDTEIMNNIVKYNETDVRLIEKIINYLRLNHCT